MNDLIIDLFAGGGGASVGIEMALGRQVDIAVNHDPAAIRMHEENHPHTLHLTEDVFRVNLQKYVQGRHVALMWASPDCTSHSKAKGGKPRERGLRVLPWAVVKHAKAVHPDVIIMENVEEIQQWGPLDAAGYPIKEKAGQDYKRFIKAMQNAGYKYQTRELVAADYGAPTIRKRWYAIFRRDGKPITWPTQTHSRYGDLFCQPWVPVSTVLDLDDWGTSIFDRKKPLADNTLKRIARGMNKFTFSESKPYIVQIGYGEAPGQLPRVNSIDDPLGTVVAAGTKHYLCTPYLIQYHSETSEDPRGQSVSEPLKTVDTSNRYGLIQAMCAEYSEGMAPVMHSDEVKQFIIKYYGADIGQSIGEPLHTITTKDRFALVTLLGRQYVIADIYMRMLKPEELKRAQGFPNDYVIDHYADGTPVSHTEQVARIGNSVVPVMAKALVRANCSYLKVGERKRNRDYYKYHPKEAEA